MHHPLVEDLDYHLRRISMLIRHNTKKLLAQYDLTLPQYHALLHLRRHQLTMGELCSHLYLASSTVTDLVDRMEKQHLVQRVRDENDRRVIRLQLLDEGREVIDRVVQDRMAFLSNRMVRLGDRKVSELLTTLKELQVLMEED